MKIKKALALILACVLCVSVLAGCGSSGAPADAPSGSQPAASAPAASTPDDAAASSAAPAPAGVPAEGTSEETLKVACDGEPNSIFPNYVTNKTCNRVDSCMFDTLVRWNDETKTVEPCLATEWEQIDDLHWQFTLRDDVTFTNGEKMTANDVVASLQASYDYTLNHYTLWLDPAECEVVDDTHVVIGLSRPYNNLPEILGCTYYAVFSAKAFDEVGNDETVFAVNPVGSGPYKLDSWQTGEKLTLVRNDDYWGELPYYKYIEFSFIQDPVARVNALKSGDVQLIFNVSTTQVAELQADENIYVNVYEQNVGAPIWLNMKNSPSLQDENVRKAMFMVLDKKMLTQAMYGEYGTPSYSSVTGQSSPYYVETEDPNADPAANVEEAKKLIAESGWTPEELTYTTYAVNGASTAQFEVLKAELAQIGITLNIETVDLMVMLEHTWAGEVPVGIAENDNWDIGRMLEFADSRIPTSWNAYVGEGEEELHALIDAAWAASDEERFDAYAAVQQWLTDHYVATNVCDVVFPDAWASNLTGVVYDAHCWPNIYNVRPLVAE